MLAPIPVRVSEVRQETHDTLTLTCEAPPAGTGKYAFRPGQFNMLYMLAVGEAAISISGDPVEEGIVRHTIRAVGSVTRALAKLRAGDWVGVRGPYGAPWPVDSARGRDVVLVTGGIGLAPLRPVLYHLLRNRQDFGRIVLLHGSRSPEDVLFAAELEAWTCSPDTQILTTVDHAGVTWLGNVGVVTTLFSQAEFDPARALGFICGPEVMMRFTLEEFEKRGVSRDRLFVSLERNMQCAVGICGHCQFGPSFVCMDGPVFPYSRIDRFFDIREA
jgi:NAD(P)H-flavin reductase